MVPANPGESAMSDANNPRPSLEYKKVQLPISAPLDADADADADTDDIW